jgi:hypothetical protein
VRAGIGHKGTITYIRRIMIFGCRDHRAVRWPPRPAETDPIVRACRFFCTQKYNRYNTLSRINTLLYIILHT